MATVGDQLKEPEVGWRRYDDTHIGLKYTGSWYKVTSTNYYNGSVNVTTRAADNNYVAFSFYGTKIRVISDIAQDRHSDNTITVDGVTESFNTYKSGTAVLNAIVYEKTNLPLGFHTVTITIGHNRTNFIMDAIDIDESGYLYGHALTSPEDGWKRYDDSSSEIIYDGWLRYPSGQTGSYNNSFSASNNTVNKKATFTFKGTKLRLITMTHSDSTTIGKISIDGTPYDVSFYSSSAINQVLVFEKTGLEDSLHTIEIYSFEAKNIRIDAVDIDLDGRMFHPDEVTSIAELEIGKRIRCHYIAARNSAGVFSRLGEETFDLISSSGSSIPMGDFYWIMVEDWNKRKFLVADRNIQNTISWDSINKDGYVFGVESTTIYKTHNKTPFITSASDVYNVTGVGTSLTNEDPWRAFASAGFWGSYAGTGLILDCKRRVKFGEIKVTAYYGANMASVIDVYGSDNNIDYTPIKSCQKSTWSNSEQATFYFDEPVEYRYYKIMKTAQVSGSNAARLNLELSYSEKIDNNHIFKLRLLTGGINTTDKDNEWDKYIVNSTLNGTIIAGDNNVWNWSGISSYSSTSSASGSRSQRGNNPVSGYVGIATNSTNSTSGFRPLIEIEILPMNRSFIKHDGAFKKYVPKEFIESKDNVIPVMTSNTTPSGIASASSINSASFDAYQAFNGIQDERYGWASLTPISWLQYQFPTKKIIYKYSLAMRTNGTYYVTGEPPKSWTFEGSNDGVNWIVLDTQTNNTTLARGSIEEYRFNNSDSYTCYRVNVSANQGNATVTVIAELKMFEKTPKGGAVGWNTISATLPPEDTFINDGMNDLSVLDRKNEVFVQIMTANGSLGSGKLFKGSINLKKYFEITSVSVK
ncbi:MULTISPECIES: hypothetical protein [Paenibacillus]|uniref:hypothetical protein n=1 Tax=Paenibacillus TaxID=44249 RepID=UPI00249B4E99|nr:hypothetical protein [Paenibacillus amylolyticus]WFA88127.1 hypothetical protein OGI70_14940 [Paenibacillus amylolyticus]